MRTSLKRAFFDLIGLASVLEERLLDVPELLREVDVVSVGILKSLDLFPESFYLAAAVISDLGDVRGCVDALAVFENRNEELAHLIVGDGLLFPGLDGVEEGERLRLVYLLVINAELIGDSDTRLAVEYSVNALEVRIGDLLGVLGDLYLRVNDAVALFGNELINTAEDGVGFCGDKSLTDAEGVYLRALTDYISYNVLVKRVGNDNSTLGKACLIEHFSRLLGKVGDIARVKTNTALLYSERSEHLTEGADSVGNTAP